MISLQHVDYHYRKGTQVLRDVSIQLLPGRIYGLLGRNGAGKSSLLHLIAGLLFPKSGTVQVGAFSPRTRNPLFLQQVFLLPEEFYVPDLTIGEFLATDSAFYPTFSRDDFYKFLDVFDIPRASRLSQLSFGMVKKVMISFALATGAKLLLFDEPTNGLDIPSKAQFRKIIAGCLREDQCMVLSTHQVKDLDNLIDDVLVIDQQKVIVNKPVQELAERLYFGQVADLSEVADPVYTEPGLRGYTVVAANVTGTPSKLDMEIFFNALQTERQKMLALLQS